MTYFLIYKAPFKLSSAFNILILRHFVTLVLQK
jgi:hypothetical protein